MSLKDHYKKFSGHSKSRDLFYAFFRGVKYLIFLVSRRMNRADKPDWGAIAKGKIKAAYSQGALNIFWQGVQITKHPGLNTAINTCGMWTDSSKARWQVLESAGSYFKVKITFEELPLSQTWTVRISADSRIHWHIDMEVEQWLYIDELRMVFAFKPDYKMWVNNYEHCYFPRLGPRWQDLCLSEEPSRLTGVCFPRGKDDFFVLAFEPFNKEKSFLPVIEAGSQNLDICVAGFKEKFSGEKKIFSPGSHHVFSGTMSLLNDSRIFDAKVESLRRNDYRAQGMIRNRTSENRLKVLLANLPWRKNGTQGVRAGSRWPHIKDISEGNYLPFPFFLAYSASLLRKNNIRADLTDAIAQGVSEDEFVKSLSNKDYNILVAETSVPSFYHDLELLKKISSLGIIIVLCGPQPQIYRRQFLKEHTYIDFVMFGEYEFTLLELAQNLEKGVKDYSHINGLIWRNKSGDIVKNPRRRPFGLNLLPWPLREGLAMEKYWDLPGNIPYPSAQMLASRGCPFSCSFCLWPQTLFEPNTYRARSVRDVVDEMEFLVREKGFKSIYFDDDTFNVGKQRMLSFCGEVISRGLNKVPWAIMAKADLMDREVLDRMKTAGLYAVKYGVESASQELVDKCGKSLDLKKAQKIIAYTKALGIKVHLTFSFGLPQETKETARKTIDYALKADPHSVQFSIITPFPGTSLFKELDSRGKILTKDWSLYDGHYSCIFEPDNFSPEGLEETKHYAYRLWADYQRKKRGLKGDLKRFFDYWQGQGLKRAFKRSAGYFNYILFQRKKFVGKV